MNILHYSLGFPPFRRGGMTQYCLDLMTEQLQKENKVALLWPGRLMNLSEKSKLVKKQKYELKKGLFCENFELRNPLPIPLMDGIRNPEIYLIKKDKKAYIDFFKTYKFDVLHIHTFMGLPIELVEAASESGIKTVFTSHDYFPICPRCNLFHAGKDCIDDRECAECVSCNKNGLSLKKMQILQTEFYKKIKDNILIKSLRARHNNKMYEYTELMTEEKIVDKKRQEEYQMIRYRNIRLLEEMDIVHFNSTNTFKVYREHGYHGKNANVISISNGAIANHKKLREVSSKIRFGYLGPLTIHKGYDLLKKACDELWESGEHNFETHIFMEINNSAPYMICHKPYSYSELPDVMDKFDVLVVPSECEETFGFTVLEALSYGIPVIVSNRVGAKDLIFDKKNGFIVECSVSGLKECLNHFIKNSLIIEEMNSYIVNKCYIKTMAEHMHEIELLYKKVILNNSEC